MLKLKDDILAVRPTVFLSVPKLYQKFYDKIKEGFAEVIHNLLFRNVGLMNIFF